MSSPANHIRFWLVLVKIIATWKTCLTIVSHLKAWQELEFQYQVEAVGQFVQHWG